MNLSSKTRSISTFTNNVSYISFAVGTHTNERLTRVSSLSLVVSGRLAGIGSKLTEGSGPDCGPGGHVITRGSALHSDRSVPIPVSIHLEIALFNIFFTQQGSSHRCSEVSVCGGVEEGFGVYL